MATRCGPWRLAPLRQAVIMSKNYMDKHQDTLRKSICQQSLRMNEENDAQLVTSGSQFDNVMSSSCSKEAEMRALLNDQRQRRIARREAFVQWQAGQREKGAAHRLVRQAKTQEKFKRHHYHTQIGRLIPVNLSRSNEAEDCWNPVSGTEARHILPREAANVSDFLVQRCSEVDRFALRLNLQKR